MQSSTNHRASKISVMIVDDHAVVRAGIRTVLELDGDFVICGEARDGEEAITVARNQQPDIILMDLLLPVLSGIDAITAIMKENPNARIMVLTSVLDSHFIAASISAGAVAYLLKDTDIQELLEKIRYVHGLSS